MTTFDNNYADCAYWCPLCGDPRSVCDAYGRCNQPSDEDWELDSPFYNESGIEEMTERSEKIDIGSYAYRIGKYEVIAMADGRWHLYLDGQATGRDYRRLTDARRAIKNEEAKSQEARSEKGE